MASNFLFGKRLRVGTPSKKRPRQILVQIDGVLKYQILLSPLIRKQVSHLFVGHGLVFCQMLY
ncbi:hypothetical protein, partial [Labilibaculum manganireducens]|uniref:hypothetical protein n=1 Tax=Labilibaculum manganireducens TaxID=1940525 RepID=UPI001C566F4A